MKSWVEDNESKSSGFVNFVVIGEFNSLGFATFRLSLLYCSFFRFRGLTKFSILFDFIKLIPARLATKPASLSSSCCDMFEFFPC